MSTMLDFPAKAPHRKPLPGYSQPAYNQPPAQPDDGRQSSHSRNRTASSTILPTELPRRTSPPQPANPMNQPPSQYVQPARRTLSNATSSTSSTANSITGLQRAPTNNAYASSIRRSTSSRSTSTTSPTSYVALMRKQKATVWCDRAQHEDPRILAAQRQAKMRAAMEVAGGHHNTQGGTRVSTSSQGIAGGVRSKIRHHGAPKASTYNAVGLSGAGVPMRLSASEVDEEDSDEDIAGQYAARFHQRNGSGRSSLGSGNRASSHQGQQKGGYSNGSTPPSGQNHSPGGSMGDLLEEETPVPNQYGQVSTDYFAQPGGQGGSGDSGSSGEREASFGNVGGLPQSRGTVQHDRKTSDELRRRGSVDDRTMTMSAGRLFVANPDNDDSD